MPETKARTKSKKVHLEIAPRNWSQIKDRLEALNNNPKRVTPELKPADLINEALDRYLSSLALSTQTPRREPSPDQNVTPLGEKRGKQKQRTEKIQENQPKNRPV